MDDDDDDDDDDDGDDDGGLLTDSLPLSCRLRAHLAHLAVTAAARTNTKAPQILDPMCFFCFVLFCFVLFCFVLFCFVS